MFAGNELKSCWCKVTVNIKSAAGTYCSSFNCVGQWGLWIALCASFNKLNWRRSWMGSQLNFRTSFVLANLFSTKPAAADSTF